MEVMYPRCAGLDVHKDSVFARVRCVSDPRHDEVKSFGTTTVALYELNEWLSTHAVTHVAMEATGREPRSRKIQTLKNPGGARGRTEI
jgi:transposase